MDITFHNIRTITHDNPRAITGGGYIMNLWITNNEGETRFTLFGDELGDLSVRNIEDAI